jgi:hypothetical protein
MADDTTTTEDVKLPDDFQRAPGTDPKEDANEDVPQTTEVIE